METVERVIRAQIATAKEVVQSTPYTSSRVHWGGRLEALEEVLTLMQSEERVAAPQTIICKQPNCNTEVYPVVWSDGDFEWRHVGTKKRECA